MIVFKSESGATKRDFVCTGLVAESRVEEFCKALGITWWARNEGAALMEMVGFRVLSLCLSRACLGKTTGFI